VICHKRLPSLKLASFRPKYGFNAGTRSERERERDRERDREREIEGDETERK
jgi:hypothetical protein